MGMNSFEKLRLGLTGGMMGSALLLAGGAVSRVQAAETRPSQRGGSSVTVTRTGFFLVHQQQHQYRGHYRAGDQGSFGHDVGADHRRIVHDAIRRL